MDGFDEIIKEFLVESYESLDELDRDLVALEDTPEDREKLASIFRTVHTIKGTAGFLAMPTLERVAHVGENLLVPLRDGDLKLNRDIADGLLGMVDAIREVLGRVESNGVEGDEDYQQLVAQLEALRDGGSGNLEVAPQTETTPEEPVTSIDSSTPATAEIERASNAGVESAPDEPATTAQATPDRKAESKAPPTGSDSSSQSHSVAESTVRIEVQLLDKLMNLVGELVLSRNQILQFSQRAEDVENAAAAQRLNLITTELQEGVMKTRMQPIRNAWSKLPRVVRDLAGSCGKQVQVRMEGADTELDKTILEAIKDPLTHIVRNSVDHGIESSEDRLAAGKPSEGTLCLRAFHEGGQVNIEISDDGGGISVGKVRDKAVEKGLITSDQATTMTDRELTNLVLLPGFSTAASVTNVSGRGVGMDVVKTNIERIGGTIDIHSLPGKGTTLRIKIPLTLAIVPALIVNSNHGQYAIPQVSLLELVRLDAERSQNEIEILHGTPVYRLRGKLLPLLYLDEQLKTVAPQDKNQANDQTINIVVLQAADHQFGLVVDSITDTQEIVVKPLGPNLKSVSAFAGATIMGDGSVALILDVIGLAQQGGILSERHRQLRDDNAKAGDRKQDFRSWLLVESADATRAAVPLESVSRLEAFDGKTIERVDNRSVVQYRDQIMPLVNLQGCTTGPIDLQPDERISVVVYGHQGNHVGIVVNTILDIVDEPVEDSSKTETSGPRVIAGRVTSVVNLDAFPVTGATNRQETVVAEAN